MKRSRRWIGLGLLCVAGSGGSFLVSCSGEGSARVGARTSGDVETFDFDRPLAEDELARDEQPGEQHRRAVASVSQQEEIAAGTGQEHALLGARHDLRLASSVTAATCQCLGIALGAPDAPGFAWQGPKPSVHPTQQIVIALGSEGIPCERNPGGQVASYRGYSMEAGNVVVTVELSQSGRPVTRGAILPRPEGTGQIYVQPFRREVPFGRGLDGSPRCSLGNPGSSNPRG